MFGIQFSAVEIFIGRRACLTVALLLALPVFSGSAAPAQPKEIPENVIVRLREELSAATEIESTTRRRLVLKRIAHSALSLVEEEAKAPNRFKVLGVAFQVQKELMVLKNDEPNRTDLLKTAKLLLDAPYEYAAERLEADVLLLQLDFDRKGATEHEQAVAIAEMADRYRGTPAEIESLIMASELAFNLGQAGLQKAMRDTLGSKFKESLKALGFLKNRFNSTSSSLMFRGSCKRVDGQTIVFPVDRAGHVYLSCFWSQDALDRKERFTEIKDLQKKYSGRFEVFSFNLDELPDAGKSTLDAMGLDWHAMHLPGGSSNEMFRLCNTDPQFLIRIINGHGYMILTPTDPEPDRYGRRFGVEEYLDLTFDKEEYLSVMQSHRIGDFLVNVDHFGRDKGPLTDEMREITKCFVPPPARYRLTKAAALANYRRAYDIGGKMLARQAKGNELAFVHNHRTIALLGLWNLTGEPKYLELAVLEANASINLQRTSEAKVVPLFALAKSALRHEGADVDNLLEEFIKATGGVDASGMAIAAAAILSLDAGSSALFHTYHEKLLDKHLDDPRLWSVTSVFLNKFVTPNRFFRGNYRGSDRRVYAGFRDWQKITEVRTRKFEMALRSLDGLAIEFPAADTNTTSVVVCMEPPADEESAKVQVEMMKSIAGVAKSHTHGKVNYIAAFVSEDTNVVRSLAVKNGWAPERVAMVPDGYRNPQVLRLNILMADERPSTFVVGADGTIRWSMTGMYQMAVGVSGITGMIMDQIWEHDLSLGLAALKRGDFASALRFYGGSFPADPRAPASSRNALRLGTARAHIGLKNWNEALKICDEIADEHEKEACSQPCGCRSLARKLNRRADILEELGKKAEAAADRERAGLMGCPHKGPIRFHADRYEQGIYNKVEGFVYRKDWQAAFDYLNQIIVAGKDGRQPERDSFASFLKDYAGILDHVGSKDRARKCSLWADALTRGIKLEATEEDDGQSAGSYVKFVTEL